MGKRRRDHDHRTCVTEALTRADAVCSGEGARLTSLRREVLAYVWRGHESVKAYEILEHLSSDTHAAKPPTVYRTLQFLLERGLVHRLESLNAFVGCPRPGDAHDSQFFICRRCGVVREMPAPRVSAAIAKEAAQAGFQVERKTVEVFGRCGGCAALGETG